MPFPARLQRTLRERAIPAAIIASLVLVALGTASSLMGSASTHTDVALSTSAPSPAAGMLYVHVVGAVNAPGVVNVPVGSRVFDAVAAAGGFSADVDQSAVNLAREIQNGEQLVFPRIGENPAAPGTAAGVPGAATALVNLNTASQAELEQLPHVGPALAARILEYRQQHGGFGSVGELSEVPGIGAKRLAELTPLVST